jgi:hypothetical protein
MLIKKPKDQPGKLFLLMGRIVALILVLAFAAQTRPVLAASRDQPPPLCENDSYEPDNTYLQASIIPTDGTRQFHINTNPPSEQDWVTFYAFSGHDYEIRTQLINDINSGDTAANDTYLYLYAPDGVTQLAFNDDVGWTTWYMGYYFYQDSLITWTAPANGWYYVEETQ